MTAGTALVFVGLYLAPLPPPPPPPPPPETRRRREPLLYSGSHS